MEMKVEKNKAIIKKKPIVKAPIIFHVFLSVKTFDKALIKTAFIYLPPPLPKLCNLFCDNSNFIFID